MRFISAAIRTSPLILMVAALAACGQGAPVGNEGGDRVKSRDEFQSRIGTAIDPDKHPGKQLYAENCAGCHDGGVYKAPSTVWLEMMAPDAVLDAMNNGLMKAMAKDLSPQQRVQIAEYLAKVSLADYKPPCAAAGLSDATAGRRPAARRGRLGP